MSRQDIFGHRYYQPPEFPSPGEIEDTRTVSIVPHNGAYLAECLDGDGDVACYLEDYRKRGDLVTLVHEIFAERSDVKIDEGG